MSNLLNKFLNNKINLKNKTNFALIIGLTPSKGARSPTLWNNAYRSFGKKTRMYPADMSEKKLEKLSQRKQLKLLRKLLLKLVLN